MAALEDGTMQDGGPSIYTTEQPRPKPRKRRRPLLIAGIVVAVLILIVVAVAGGFYLTFYLKVHAANNRVDPQVQQVLDAPPTTLVPDTASQSAAGSESSPEPPVNLVMLGSDARPDGRESTGSSDVIILLHIDRQNDFLSVMSVTRDLWVSIPGYGQDRINAAYTKGGPALTIATLKQTFGVNLNKYMEVGFNSFAEIVDSLDGVYVDVDRRYSPSETDLDLVPGFQLLNGANALKYSRFRYDENADFGRMTRQQRILGAIRDQVGGWDLATKMPGMVSTLLDYSATNLGANELIGLGTWMVRLDGSRMKHVMIRSNGTMIDGKAVVVVDKQTIVDAVTDFLTPPAASGGADTGGMGGGAGVSAAASGCEAPTATAGAGAVQLAAGDSAVRLALATTTTAAAVPAAAKWKTAQANVPFALQAPAYLPEGFAYAYKNPEGQGPYSIKVGKETRPAVCVAYQFQNTSEWLRVTATTWLEAPLAHAGPQTQKDGVTYTVVGTSEGAERVWWTKDGVLYSVSNTLMHKLTRQELLKVAESMVAVASLE